MCSLNLMNLSSLSYSLKEQTDTCQSFQPSFKDLERIQLVRVVSVWLIHVEARKTLNIYPSIATVLPTNWIACHLHTQLQIAQIHQIMTSNCHRSAADDSWLSQRPVQCPSTVNCRNATPNQLWYVVKIPMWSTSWTPELRAKCEKKEPQTSERHADGTEPFRFLLAVLIPWSVPGGTGCVIYQI